MLTGRDVLEWGWRSLKSLGHPWDWLQISAAGLSSTSFPVQPPFPLAAPVRLVCMSGKWLLQERGFFKDVEDGRLSQPRHSENICWMNKEALCAGGEMGVFRAWDVSLNTAHDAYGCVIGVCFRVYRCIGTHKSVCPAPATQEQSTSVSATGVQLCKRAVCYSVSI